MNKVGVFRKKQKKGETELNVDLAENLKLKGLWNICRENDYHVVHSILRTYSSDAIPLWDSLRDMLEADGMLYFIVREYLKSEIQNTRDHQQLFRTNTGITHLMSSIMRKECHEVLVKYVDEIIKEVNKINHPIEIDPNKTSYNDAKQNVDLIIDILEKKVINFDSIVSMVSPKIKYLLTFIKQEVQQKFPNEAILSVGGFFFLRFLNPALIAPQRYGDFLTRANDNGHQALMIITKIVQAMANQPQNPFNEDYMIPFGTYCLMEYSLVNTFLENISSQYEQPPIKRINDETIVMKCMPSVMRTILGFREDIMKNFKEELRKVRGLEERFIPMIKSNTTYRQFVYIEEAEAIPEMMDTMKEEITYYEKKVNVLSEKILDLYHFISEYIPNCHSLKDISSIVLQTRKKNLTGEPVEKLFKVIEEKKETDVDDILQTQEPEAHDTPVQQSEDSDDSDSIKISVSSDLSQGEDDEALGIVISKKKYKDISDDGEWSRSDSEDFVEKYQDTYKKIVDIKEQAENPHQPATKMQLADYKAMIAVKYKIPEELHFELKNTIHAFHRLLHKCHRCDDPKRLYHVTVELIIVIQKFNGKKDIVTQHKDAEGDVNMVPSTRELIDRLCKLFIEKIRTDPTLTIEHFKRIQNYINEDVIKYIKEDYDDLMLLEAQNE